MIKQLALALWKYNKVKSIPKKDALICVERIQDGLYLEKILSALRPIKLINDKAELQNHLELYQAIDKYIEELSLLPILDLVQSNSSFTLTGKKIELVKGSGKNKSTDFVFKCAPNSKICLEGYSEQELQNNACKNCQNGQCPSSPTRTEDYKKSPIAIATHQSFLKSDEWGNTRKGSGGGQRNLLLIDEKPDIFKTHLITVKKKGKFFETSLDELVEFLKEVDKAALYRDINDNFLGKLKSFYTKSRKNIAKLNSGKQTHDIFKS